MQKAWYYNAKHGQRWLSLKTIAEYFDCDMETVQKAFDGKIVYPCSPSEDAVDAGEVVRFLVRNSLPVSSSILPPNSTKILNITSDKQVEEWQRNYIDLVLSYFQEHRNILVEYIAAGKIANLAVLTFTPDVVICSLQKIDETITDTLSLISNLPELNTIFVGSESVLKWLHTLQMLPENCLTISNNTAADELRIVLKSVFNTQ